MTSLRTDAYQTNLTCGGFYLLVCFVQFPPHLSQLRLHRRRRQRHSHRDAVRQADQRQQHTLATHRPKKSGRCRPRLSLRLAAAATAMGVPQVTDLGLRQPYLQCT